ncbi:carbohydrate porin [Sphingomonas sp. PB4P5]|uniref:carbohydrate porin n=1 Tax=Parasphingomonas puruogangriensis TaxID=3096155 RepID=UPI002FC9480E
MLYRFYLLAGGLLVCPTLAQAQAQAQAQVGAPQPVAQPAQEPAKPAPDIAGATTPVPTGIAGWQKTNAVGKALRDLREDGIALTANYVGNVAGNPVGGVKQGVAESHWVDVGAELDLEKLLGLSGTTLHIQGAAFGGTSLAAEKIGNSISFQQTWRPVPGLRLTQFNIDKDFGKHLNVLVGRAALNSYFANSPLNCVFMSNTSCLTAYGPITAIGITAFPNSSWAAKARWGFTKQTYVQLGVFDYNNELNLHGKGGLDLSLFQGTGVLIAGEAGYETTLAQDRYAKRYRVGFYANTDGGTDPLHDRNGASAALTGLPRVQQDGARLGLYAIGDQTVSRPDPNSPRNLALFARVFYNAGETSTIDWFASAGFVQTGTFHGRNADTIGFLVSDTHFSDDEVTYLRDLRAKAGGSGTPPRNEIVGEINYGFAAAAGVRLLPNVQYVLNPDPINATRFAKDIPSAVVIGLRVDIRLAQVFAGS